jgi:hypothetical protein
LLPIDTPDWAARGPVILAAVRDRLAAAGVGPEDFGLVVLQRDGGRRPAGLAHRGDWRAYPCSLVKPFHLVHALSAVERGQVQGHAELDRALADMIAWSSNTATNYVIDTITGTTGNSLLEGRVLANWADRRARLNRFFLALGWPEFAGCNITQKLMDDVRYGREAQYAGRNGENLNLLTPLAAARLMWNLFEGDMPLSDPARARAQMTLWRDRDAPEAAQPRYQLAGYLGGALPGGVDVWSKAGHNLWTGDPRASWFKHDMIRVAGPGRKPLTMVLMTRGRAIAEGQDDLFPEIGRMVWDMAAEAGRDGPADRPVTPARQPAHAWPAGGAAPERMAVRLRLA